MSLAGDIAGVAAQLAALLIFSGGGGCWLWLATGRPPGFRGHNWLWLALAGLALIALLLQSLVYCGVPLAASAGLAFGLAATGLVVVAVQRWRAPAASKVLGKDPKLILLVLLIGVAGQLPALLTIGPARFYGTAKNDQPTYVLLAEFLMHEPFDLRVEEVGYRPWIERALEVKESRLTQSIVLGSVAVVTKTSAQEAYGTVSLFFVALAGMAVTAWMRREGVPRLAAGCAGLAMALSPAITRVNLDSYFSQVASLFVLPALAAVLGGRGPLRRETKIISVIFLAYLMGTYTEVAVFGFGFMVVLVGIRAAPWRERLSTVLLIGAGALLLNPGYFVRWIEFSLRQWHVASSPGSLSGIFPDSGTLLGWGRLFFDFRRPTFTQAGGILVGALAVWGAVRQAGRRRYTVALAVAIAVAPLVALRLLPNWSGYVFMKLCIQFMPVWIAGAFLGIMAMSRSRRWSERWLPVAGAAWVALTALTAFQYQQQVMHPEGLMAELSSPRLLALRREVEARPGSAYLVASDEPLLAQWLCYFGRESEVVVDRRTVGDQILPTEAHACRRWDNPAKPLLWLDPERHGPVVGYEPPPLLLIKGAREAGGDANQKYYAAGDSLDFAFERPAGGQARQVWLDFVIIPWRAGEPCQLEMTEPSGKRFVLAVTHVGWYRWPLVLEPGTSLRRLQLRNGAHDNKDPVAVIKLVSVEVSPVLPSWQSVTEAVVVAAEPHAP